MDSVVIPDSPIQSIVQNGKKGCSGVAAIILLSIWIMVVSLITQVTNWTVFQMIFEGSVKVPNIRWIFTLAYGSLLFVPLLIAGNVVQEPVMRSRIHSLRNVAGLVLLLTPARLPSVTDWQQTVIYQLIAFFVFLLITVLFNYKRLTTQNSFGFIPGLGLSLVAAASGLVIGIPWIMWGALGSITDTALALLLGVGVGLVTAIVLITEPLDLEKSSPEEMKPGGIGAAGWVISLGLLIMATGIDHNSNGWMLALSAIPVGFASALLAGSQDLHVYQSGRWAAGILAGLMFLWPILMIDPDELSLVISGGSGELFEYTGKASAISFGLSLLIMLLLFFLRKRNTLPHLSITKGAGFFVTACLGITGLYFLGGTPGFYGEKSFVIMKEQPDLASVNNIMDSRERREQVYSVLVQAAADSQKDIRSWLDAKGIAYKPYYLVNAIEVDADPIVRASIEARADVDRVLDSPILRPLQNPVPVSNGMATGPEEALWNIQMTSADKVHNELGVYGAGVIVGQSDSGVQGDHSELESKYRGKTDGTDNYNWFDPWFGSSTPVDIGGHGTHTLGSILGENVGIAPKAQWIGCVNLARNLGNPGYYLDCMQFMLAPFPQDGDPFKDGNPSKGANVLNNSWGCPVVEGCDPDVFKPAVSALRTAGVFVVASAGNAGMGGCSTVQDPLAIYEDVYTVGAIDSNGNLAGFSSVGPVTVDGSNRIKPDIMAPGVDVFSSYPGSTYETASGTSMAGPHVVGVVALMWSANPALIGDIDSTIKILNETADPYKGVLPGCADESSIPGNAAGYGIVNAYRAVQRAIEFQQQ